ncbi:Uncharacterised protein [Mycobacterium tuberculosis]|nr:Uncharacterised protein [Mycobacterium tuberculosis]
MEWVYLSPGSCSTSNCTAVYPLSEYTGGWTMWAGPRQSGFDTAKALVSMVDRPPRSCMPVAPMMALPSSTVSRNELNRSSGTRGDVVVGSDDVGAAEVGALVAGEGAGEVAGVFAGDEQPATATAPAAASAANRVASNRIRVFMRPPLR